MIQILAAPDRRLERGRRFQLPYCLGSFVPGRRRGEALGAPVEDEPCPPAR